MSTQNSGSAEPKWLRDIRALLLIRPHFILTGNIRDRFLVDQHNPVTVIEAIQRTLFSLGFEALLVWDEADGLTLLPGGNDEIRGRFRQAMPNVQEGPLGVKELTDIIRFLEKPPSRERRSQTIRLGLVIDHASRLRSGQELTEPLRRLFLNAEKAALNAEAWRNGSQTQDYFTPVFWLANRPNDLPDWYSVDNERVRSIPIGLPDADMRVRIAERLGRRFTESPAGCGGFAVQLSAQTHNMSTNGLFDVVKLALARNQSADDIDDAVRSYRIGDTQLNSPWRGDLLRSRIAQAQQSLSSRVMGQDAAVTKVLDILKRTSIGLTGAHARGSSGRPRGVLFFAGPTGVGKTEMAKAIAKIVFDDDSAYLRFDMSEFSAEHSADRLIGAPPGYVGFDQGGELTNAMREQPFRVVLFDEIEKAHGRILDKFLQVLEDGRLTDGRGETVFFSESLIIFTSNAGVGNISPGDDPAQFEEKLRAGVRGYFVEQLGRPELLNRFGENVVLFNFITSEVAGRIFQGMLDNIRDRIQGEHGIQIKLEPSVQDGIKDYCTQGLENGGRGIGARLEAAFVNPLARLLFDCMPSSGNTFTITHYERHPDGHHELQGR